MKTGISRWSKLLISLGVVLALAVAVFLVLRFTSIDVNNVIEGVIVLAFIAFMLFVFVPWSKKDYDTIKGRRSRVGVLFILPFIIGFCLFMLKPIVNSLLMSLYEMDGIADGLNLVKWNNFNNYHYAMSTDPNFFKYLFSTANDFEGEVWRMLINIVATLVMSFVIAVILNQNFKGRTVCRVIFFLPVILSSGVLPGIESSNEFYNLMSGIGESVEDASGVNISAALQDLLSVSGVAGDVFDVIFKMIDAIYDVVMASGIQIIVFLSGLQSISPSLYEAADVEGCSAWEAFWKITFPMVSPLLLVNLIYTIIDFFMKNNNKVMEYITSTVMYRQGLFGYASAMSWIYFGVALAMCGLGALIVRGVVKSYE